MVNIYYLKAVLSAAFLFIITSVSLSAKDNFNDRYLWVVRNSLTTKSNIDEMLNFATLNRFNNILVQVRGRGDSYYNSKLVPKSILIKDLDFDPLAYLIPKAKEKGVKVHAWVNTYLLWSSRIKPVQKMHLIYTEPNWLDQNNRVPIDLERELKRSNGGKNGYEGLYLSPNHPKVASYLLSIFKELLEDYDIDGLHLDYVRYHDSGYGMNPRAIAYYKKYNGFSSLSDDNLNKNEKSEWSDYRRKSITDLVRSTKNMIELISPSTELSAAVKPNLYQARERFYQEWDVWVVAGYIDKVLVMNYAKELQDFAANIDIIYDNMPYKYWDKIIMGIATYNQSPKKVIDKIKYSKVTRFNGIAFFSYNVMSKNPRYFLPIKNILYKD